MRDSSSSDSEVDSPPRPQGRVLVKARRPIDFRSTTRPVTFSSSEEEAEESEEEFCAMKGSDLTDAIVSDPVPPEALEARPIHFRPRPHSPLTRMLYS